MSARSIVTLSPVSWAGRLGGRGALVLLIAGGATAVAAAAVIWLAVAVSEPEQVAVEVALPPPAPQSPAEAASPSPPPVQPDGSGSAADDPSAVRPGAGNMLSVPPVPADAFARVPPAPRSAPLPPAPDPALVDATAEGPLPRRGPDGRLPWQAYARPFPDGERRARIAVVVAGLGASAIVTGEIIRRLPADVTLAFEPAAGDVDRWAREARAAGHEIMLSLPVQGAAFPFVDRGPEALAGDATAAQNRVRLDRLLARLTGYVGALARVGAEAGADGDAAAAAALELAGKALADRGLLLATPFPVEAAAADAPQLRVDLAVGADADPAAVRAKLAELETLAAAKGHALAVLEPTPAAAEALAAWAGGLGKRAVVLAPVSAVARAVQAGDR